MTRVLSLIAALAGACMASIAIAQTSTQQPDQEPVYSPLFSEAMIHNASPTQAVRMREAEARNRQAFETRRQARRDQQASQQTEAAERERRAAASASTPRRNKSKVFKWVDADGRVHFGDAPRGQDAKEIKVGGAARVQGTPLPPPGQARKADDSN